MVPHKTVDQQVLRGIGCIDRDFFCTFQRDGSDGYDMSQFFYTALPYRLDAAKH